MFLQSVVQTKLTGLGGRCTVDADVQLLLDDTPGVVGSLGRFEVGALLELLHVNLDKK